MPNWCDNVERIAGPKEEVKPLYDNLVKWIHDDVCPNGFKDGWLGNIVGHAGLEADPDPDNWRLRCRGELVDGFTYEEEDGEGIIGFSTYTAWVPFPGTWNALLKKWAPAAKYYYIAFEPGACIYESNDINHRFFDDAFVIDCCLWEREKLPPEYQEDFRNIEDGMHWDWNPDEVIDMMERVTGMKTDHRNGEETDRLMEAFREKTEDMEGDNYINVYRIDYYDPDADK